MGTGLPPSAVLDGLPDLHDALATAIRNSAAQIYDAFRLSVEIDRNKAQIRLKARDLERRGGRSSRSARGGRASSLSHPCDPGDTPGLLRLQRLRTSPQGGDPESAPERLTTFGR